MTLIGYARVSTGEQTTDPQADELRRAGCCDIRLEHASGANASRPVLNALLREMSAGDVLLVVRIDRLARSLSHLLQIIEHLRRRGAHFRSLRDPFDTASPQGIFMLQMLGAMAEFERALIRERTVAGLAAARARGRLGGNPLMRARNPEALGDLAENRRAAYIASLQPQATSILQIARRLRLEAPKPRPWDEVVHALNKQTNGTWTLQRLKRAIKALIAEEHAEPTLLARAPQRRLPAGDSLLMTVAFLAEGPPKRSLRQIAAELERRHLPPPRGQSMKWSPSSVAQILARARATNLLHQSDRI
jgi:DNA invertase Pin-like site-specific DNA recombinase